MDMTYVVPVSASRLERLLGEAEGALPLAGSLARERKLALVAVPCADEMGGLDFGAGGKGEGELRHYCSLLLINDCIGCK